MDCNSAAGLVPGREDHHIPNDAAVVAVAAMKAVGVAVVEAFRAGVAARAAESALSQEQCHVVVVAAAAVAAAARKAARLARSLSGETPWTTYPKAAFAMAAAAPSADEAFVAAWDLAAHTCSAVDATFRPNEGAVLHATPVRGWHLSRWRNEMVPKAVVAAAVAARAQFH